MNNDKMKKEIPCTQGKDVRRVCVMKFALKSKYSSQVSAILDETEVGALAHLWGPIYVLQRGPNYPT
jgi:hypothetical protein